MKNVTSFRLVAVQLFAKAAFSAPTPFSLPLVDLGYAIHQATVNDSAYPYYNFSNIRFGASPTGSLRFAPPIPPNTINRTINDGQLAQNCPQANPGWLSTVEQFLEGTPVPTLANETSSAKFNLSSIPPLGSQTSEDCLFLDVFVPQKIFESPCGKESPDNFRPGIDSSTSNGAAVLVWIYGGAYDFGTKTANGNPAGLIAQSLEIDGEGIIFVEINYRLGLFGWLSGSDLTPNAGLHDQRLALEWVQKYIYLFGGDPSRVTVIGESAGGGSIEHQIIAYSGSRKVPFQQAILQSPGFIPSPDRTQQLALFEQTLSTASLIAGTNITSASQLRNLSFEQLYLTNAALVASAPYGKFVFGPVTDDHFVPDLPSTLLSEGKFAKDLKVMVAYNTNDGYIFSSPFLQTSTDFSTYVSSFLPPSFASNTSLISYITDVLYPPTTNQTGYTTQLNRTSLFYSELVFTCNTRFLDLAFKNQTYGYQFNVGPGFHEEDIPYTFFNGDTTTIDDVAPVNATVAETMQRYLVNFVMKGDPNEQGMPEFPVYGEQEQMLNIDTVGLGTSVRDKAANERCEWWQEVLSNA